MKALLTTALLSGFLCAACKKQEGPNCRDVAGHVIELVRAELAKQNSSEQLTAAQANLPTLKDALTNACEDKKWSTGTRQCIVNAKTAAETEACDPAVGAPITSSNSE